MVYTKIQLQQFITNKLIGKQNAVPYNRQTFRWFEIRDLLDYYHDIIEITNYLPDDCVFNERCYQLIHGLTESPTCKSCDNQVSFVGFTPGYNTFCKPTCATKGKKQIDVLIEKFGKDIGTTKYNIMIKNKTQTEKRFTELYGEKEGKKRWKSRNKKCKTNATLEGYIDRYGNEKGKIEYIKRSKRLSKSLSLVGFIERYGEKIGTQKYNETIRKKSQTLDRFIELYGDEDGLEKYNNFRSNQSKKSTTNVSKESITFFNPILDFILEKTDNNIIQNTYIGKRNKQEYFLHDKELNKTYFYDLKSRKCEKR